MPRIRRLPFLRLRADAHGGTAVEFALVVMPFFALLFAIAETALIYLGGGMLQTAVYEASRAIMTGEARSFDRATFKNSICDRLVVLFDCRGKLDVDVRTMTSLQGAGRASPYVNGSYNTQGWGFAPGGAGAIVVVTAAYQWPAIMNFGGFNLSEGTSKARILLACAAFKNEQY